MTKLVNILILALLASTTVCHAVCYEKVTVMIRSYIEQIERTGRRACNKIGEISTKNSFNESTYWSTVKEKIPLTTSQVVLDHRGENLRIVNSSKINDGACRRFQKNFSLRLVQQCAKFQRYSCLVDILKIVRIGNAVIGYFKGILARDGNEIRPGYEEESCEETIQEARNVFTTAVLSIENVVNHTRMRMNDFVGHMSVCLMNRSSITEVLFIEWKNACSFYDNVV